jgi:uncharacterized protein YcbX
MPDTLWSDGDAVVAATCIYPIKSCGAMPVDELVFDRWGGAEGDRRWAVVDASGSVTWQGAHPRLALVQPRIAGAVLALRAPGHEPLDVRDDGLAACEVGMYNEGARRTDVFAARAAGAAADRWISAVAGAPLRLVRLGDEAVGRGHAERLHVVTLESAREVDALLRARGAPAADVLRYRPNVVLAGQGAPLVPFVEDVLEAMAWAYEERELRLDVTGRCVRCIVPDVDPATGVAGADVLPALAELSAQRLPGQPTAMGAYGNATPGGRLARGQAVRLAFAF